MKPFKKDKYRETVHKVAKKPWNWKTFDNKTILITGATGLIGSFLIDVLMQLTRDGIISCKVVAVGRNADEASVRFVDYWDEKCFTFLTCDITEEFPADAGTVDFMIHAASNTHPIAYATDPIGTITTNIIGTKNILDAASKLKTQRVVFISSVEIYGENRGDIEAFDELYCGYLDCNTLRAGYPEGKRAGEALCQAYIRQKGLDIVISRLPRVYGPTMRMNDSKALSQFIKKGLNKEDIVLKSEGTQLFSYLYVADAVSGILHSCLYGENGQAYNYSCSESDIMLKDLAQIVAEYASVNVTFELPDAVERSGYSKATVAVLDSSKARAMGWSADYNIKSGLKNTLDILSE